MLSSRVRACATNVSDLSSSGPPASRAPHQVVRSNRLTRASSCQWQHSRMIRRMVGIYHGCVCSAAGLHRPDNGPREGPASIPRIMQRVRRGALRPPGGRAAGRRTCGRGPAACHWRPARAPGRSPRCGLATASRLRQALRNNSGWCHAIRCVRGGMFSTTWMSCGVSAARMQPDL